MNKIKNTKRINLSDLREFDTFRFPEHSTFYEVVSKGTFGNLTRVTYRIVGSDLENVFTKVNFTSVLVVTD